MSEPDDPSDEPWLDPLPPTEEEIRAWLLTNPKRADWMIEIMEGTFAEKRDGMSPEGVEEVERVLQELKTATADLLLKEVYNALVDRLREMHHHTSPVTEEEMEELRNMDKQLSELLDIVLGMREPARTKAVKTMQATQKELRKLLAYLERE